MYIVLMMIIFIGITPFRGADAVRRDRGAVSEVQVSADGGRANI